MTSETENRAEHEQAQELARAAYVVIATLVRTHESATTPAAQVAAHQAILENAPSIAVRTNWQLPGTPAQVGEYRILLSAGAPLIQIIGDLEGDKPYSARLGYQDWFTRWEECPLTEAEEETLLTYARFFSYDK